MDSSRHQHQKEGPNWLISFCFPSCKTCFAIYSFPPKQTKPPTQFRTVRKKTVSVVIDQIRFFCPKTFRSEKKTRPTFVSVPSDLIFRVARRRLGKNDICDIFEKRTFRSTKMIPKLFFLLRHRFESALWKNRSWTYPSKWWLLESTFTLSSKTIHLAHCLNKTLP